MNTRGVGSQETRPYATENSGKCGVNRRELPKENAAKPINGLVERLTYCRVQPAGWGRREGNKWKITWQCSYQLGGGLQEKIFDQLLVQCCFSLYSSNPKESLVPWLQPVPLIERLAHPSNLLLVSSFPWCFPLEAQWECKPPDTSAKIIKILQLPLVLASVEFLISFAEKEPVK